MDNQISNTLISNNGHLTKEHVKSSGFFTRGYRTAGKHSGSPSAYRITLEGILWKLIHRNSKLNEAGENLNRSREEEKERINAEINIKNDSVLSAKRKSEELLNEISAIAAEKEEIKKSNDENAGKAVNKFRYYAYLTVITGLTLYLFFFYTSVVYSAFFRVVNIAKDTVFNSIFYPNAIADAAALGVTALAVTLLAPFIFLAVALLMHSVSAENKKGKLLKLGLLGVLVFAMDALFAYHISERLHDAKMINSFEKVSAYSIPNAAADLNFWLVIACGFVVYLLLGGLISKFEEERNVNLKKERLLDNCDNRIALLDLKKQRNADEMERYEKEIADLGLQLAALNKENRMVTWSPAELKMKLSDFTLGWIQYLKNGRFGENMIKEVENDFRDFIKSKEL